MRLGHIIALFILYPVVFFPAFSQGINDNVLELNDSSLNDLATDSLLFIDSIAKSVDPFFDQSNGLNPQNSINSFDSIGEELKFSIYKQDIDDQTSVFNSLVFVNKTNKLVSGKINLQLPSGWIHLVSQQLEFMANPGETIYIPMRLIAPKNMEGGKSYIIGATVSLDDDKKIKAYAYIQKAARFDLSVINQNNSILINPIELSGETGIRIINQGNVSENINLSFNYPLDYKLIAPVTSFSTSFNLKAKSDTVILIKLKRTVLTDSLRSENLPQERLKYSIYGSGRQIEGSFLIENYQSSLIDETYKELSPLFITAGVFNIGNPGGERYMSAAGGKLQLNAKTDVNYYLGSFNLGQVGIASLGEGTTRSIYQYRLGIRRGLSRVDLSSNFYNKHIPLRYQGLRYNYQGKKIVFATEAGKSYLPDTYVSSTSLSINSFALPFNIGYSTTFGNNNFNVSAFEAGVKTPVSRLLRLGVGATYYLGEITSPGAVAPRNINRLGYYAAGDFNAGRLSMSGRWNFRPTNGFAISGDRSSLVISGKIKTDKAFHHRFNTTDIRQDFTRGDFSNNLENRFASWTTTYNTASNWMISLNPQYRSIVRESVLPSVTTRLSTFYYGSSFGLSKRLNPLEVVSVFANPMITNAVYDFESSQSGSYTMRTELSPAYNLGLRYSRNNALNITGDIFRGPFFIYNYSVSTSDTLLIPFSSGLIRLSAGYNKDFKISNINLNLNLRAFYSLDVITKAEQLNIGANAIASLPQGIRISSYINWFASSYESRSGEISNKNININAAITKSFYWQQPYEKFYKMNILCYEDLNGNGNRERHEPVLPNITISLRAEKEDFIDKKHSRSPNTDLITDVSGRVKFNKIPAATYDVKFYELFSVSDLHPTYGFVQEILLNDDKTIEVPFIKNYHVRGKISIIKSKRSRVSSFNIEGLIIIAESEKGEVYRTLTDEFGNYNLTIPGAGVYKLTCKHGYGEILETKNDETLVDFNGMKEFNFDFMYYEKDRVINFPGSKLEEKQVEERQVIDELKSAPKSNEAADFSQSLANEIQSDKLESYEYPEKTISRQEAIEQIGADFEINIEYRVVIGRYKDYLKNEDLERMLDVVKGNQIKVDVLNNYLVVNRDFNDKENADRFTDSLRNIGIETSVMLGKYQDVLINLE